MFEPKLDPSIFTRKSMPDIAPEGHGRPRDDFVISRDRKGNAVSLYCHDVWDLSPYHLPGQAYTTIIHFTAIRHPDKALERKCRDEMKRLMFAWIYFHPGAGTLRPSTLNGRLYAMLPLVQVCMESGISLSGIGSLKDDAFIACFSEMHQGAFEAILNILRQTWLIGPERVGFELISAGRASRFKNVVKAVTENQTPVIPQRIYAHVIEASLAHVNEFLSVESSVRSLLKQCISDRAFGVRYEMQWVVDGKLSSLNQRRKPTFEEATEKLGLSAIFSRMSGTPSKLALTRYLQSVRQAAKNVIHAFTGMREGEVLSIFEDCLRPVRHFGKTATFISSGTSKLHGGIGASWVTSADIKPAVKALGLVRRMRFDRLLRAGVLTQAEFCEVPLFSVATEPWVRSGPIEWDGSVKKRHLLFLPAMSKRSNPSEFGRGEDISHHSFFLDPEIMKITQGDIDEISRVDPRIVLRGDIQVGELWPLASHQFRRTLVVYAARSGAVSLPTLRRQLKHLTSGMTEYYSKGSHLASVLGKTGNDLVEEYQEERTQVVVAQLFDVFHEVKVLEGAKGHWIAAMRNQPPTFFHDRRQIERKVRNGELALRETAVAQCMNVDYCDLGSFTNFSSCLDCGNALFTERDAPRMKRLRKHLSADLQEMPKFEVQVRESYEAQIVTLDDLIARIGRGQRKASLESRIVKS